MKNPFGFLKRHRLTLEELPRQPRPARVLLAEEDTGSRADVAAALREAGYEVLAADRRELERQLRAQASGLGELPSFDLVVYDLGEAARSDLQTLQALRRADWVSPIIALCDEQAATACPRLATTVLPGSIDGSASLAAANT